MNQSVPNGPSPDLIRPDGSSEDVVAGYQQAEGDEDGMQGIPFEKMLHRTDTGKVGIVFYPLFELDVAAVGRHKEQTKNPAPDPGQRDKKSIGKKS